MLYLAWAHLGTVSHQIFLGSVFISLPWSPAFRSRVGECASLSCGVISYIPLSQAPAGTLGRFCQEMPGGVGPLLQ